MENTKRIKVTPLYKDYVLDNKYDCVVQVGGRFSGKSHNEQIRLIANMSSKENYKLLVIENLETGMSDGFHAGLYERIRDFEHEVAYTAESKVAHIRNKINDNVALFRGYDTEQQKYNVKKLSSITEILVEEGEWMTFDDFISLYQQLRGGHEEDRKLTILLNPVNPDCFVNESLVESTPDEVLEYFEGTKRPKVFVKHITTKFKLDDEEQVVTIKVLVVLSTHFDNNYLTLEQRASIEQYKETDPDKYLQLGEARFIRSSGVYFREFDKAIHTCEAFIIPDHWKRYISIDYGLDMFAALWYAIDTHNNIYVYKEYNESDLVISNAANKLLEINNSDRYECIYAPVDLWSTQRETGKSGAEIWRENGVSLLKSNNKRVLGWYNVKEGLKPVKTKNVQTGEEVTTSRVQIFDNCTELIKNIPKAMKDEKNPNDVDTEPHDISHNLDSLRYFLITRVFPSTLPSKPEETYESFYGKKRKDNSNQIVDNSFINMGVDDF